MNAVDTTEVVDQKTEGNYEQRRLSTIQTQEVIWMCK